MNKNTILECSPGKNIAYYLSNAEFYILNEAKNNWDAQSFGKFSINKCLNMLKEIPVFKEEKLFQDIIKEEGKIINGAL